MDDLLYGTNTESEASVTNSNRLANRRSEMIAHRIKKYNDQRTIIGQCIPSARYSSAKEMYMTAPSLKKKPEIIPIPVVIDESQNLNELPDLKPSVIALEV